MEVLNCREEILRATRAIVSTKGENLFTSKEVIRLYEEGEHKFSQNPPLEHTLLLGVALTQHIITNLTMKTIRGYNQVTIKYSICNTYSLLARM